MAFPGGFFPEHADLDPGVRLRPLALEEAGAAAAALSGMDPWLTLEYRAESLEAHLRRPDPSFYKYALEKGGELAGVVCLRHPWLLGPYLETLGLWPGFQGQGLGETVINWLIESCRERARNLWTAVSAFNHRARRFYARHGFVEVGVLTDLVKPGFNEILLRRILVS